MIVLVGPLAAAVLLAALRGRSLRGLARERIAWWPLACFALATELVLSSASVRREPWAIQWGSMFWVAALAAMVVVLARNALVRPAPARWAWAAAASGVLLNLVVVVANGGHMPQSQTARLAADVSTERVAGLASDPGWRNVAPMAPETRLALLGDVLPDPAWLPIRNVMSLGDLLLALGLAGACYCATRPRAASRRSAVPPVGLEPTTLI
ncbi:MAG: DUF5317 family protein, partial [Chloroflexota bacterium]|nr:DUF5317 family protein [Chloroflexota bacterium]